MVELPPVNPSLYYQESHQMCEFTNSKLYVIQLTPHWGFSVADYINITLTCLT